MAADLTGSAARETESVRVPEYNQRWYGSAAYLR